MATTGNPLSDIANAAKAGLGAITGGNNLTQQVTGVKGATPQSNVAAVAGAASSGVSAAQAAANAAGSTISSVSDFLQGLTTANLWIRIAKVIAGGVILMIGLAKITGLDQKATGVAAKVMKAAPLV